MLNVVAVNWRNYQSRGIEYTNNLFDAVRRNLEDGTLGRFLVFTDEITSGYSEGIEQRLLPTDLIGWFNKIYLFKDGLFSQGDRVLFFDLDTVITGSIDALAKYDGEFAILRDFYRPNGLQSSVMAWRAGDRAEIWRTFEAAGCPMDDPGGDQSWIEKRCHPSKVQRLQVLFPDMFVSYKQCKGIPQQASVVVFHGRPRPHEVTDGWVPQVWKIGGLSHAELKAVCNTELEKLLGNVKANCLRDVNWFAPCDEHDGHVAILGGGPSLLDMTREIKWRESQGQHIWALNNAWRAIDIHIDAQVLLDARPETADFICEDAGEILVASQCTASVLDRLEGKKTTLWHANTPGIADFLENEPARPAYLVGGGTTVGMNAIALAFLRGYRKIHLYGFDCCFRGDAHHAYPQALNDKDPKNTVLYGEKNYICAPWMVGQAQEFMEMVPAYVADGCVITVHGSGLLQDIARDMANSPADETKVVNGLMWPSHDFQCAAVVFESVADLERAYAHCTNFGVCIQAGGNCGVWPLALSKKFKTVYTFEPDPLNFKCLKHNANSDNIIKFNAALGNDNDSIDLERPYIQNCGAHYVKKGGGIPTVRIDDLALSECDLIYLDIEGYEFEAIKGAIGTIKRFRPVLAFEDKGLSSRYGRPKGDLEKWLAENLEYGVVERFGRDVIMTPRII